jgi:putative hydrolase of the HAD superfamily
MMNDAGPRHAPADGWQRCDTVLLDMDGTLLDLAFDNWFWREAVPRCLVRMTGGPAEDVRAQLLAHYERKRGSLDWYCLDYWTTALGLDLRSLKAAASHRIRYLPGARDFLQRAHGSGKRLVLVTNAHGDALAIKQAVSGLGRFFEVCVTSHEFGAPKEAAEFWPRLCKRLGFDPQRTLFVDDSESVLDAAARFGLGAVVAVTRPDTRCPSRDITRHASVEAVWQLLDPP